ncbi:hypothetical protein LJB42_002233 [Komagataella kurtzmanii]|nr:hypothetical protein LJB42_002233 [Komagataella kurtzmanii]
MASIYLNKRWIVSNGWSNSNARWAFFALFIVFIIGFLLLMCRTNLRRMRRGQKPIRGTAWLTPPSYGQSQQQYNTGGINDSVPVYSSQARAEDAGYYDAEGVFHYNPHYVPAKPMATAATGSTNTQTYPPQAYHTPGAYDDFESTPNRPTQTPSDDDFGYTRPSHPPPVSSNLNTPSDADRIYDTTGEGTSSSNIDDELPGYQPPSSPPPAARKN